jgi:hypothetical protein
MAVGQGLYQAYLNKEKIVKRNGSSNASIITIAPKGHANAFHIPTCYCSTIHSSPTDYVNGTCKIEWRMEEMYFTHSLPFYAFGSPHEPHHVHIIFFCTRPYPPHYKCIAWMEITLRIDNIHFSLLSKLGHCMLLAQCRTQHFFGGNFLINLWKSYGSLLATLLICCNRWHVSY